MAAAPVVRYRGHIGGGIHVAAAWDRLLSRRRWRVGLGRNKLVDRLDGVSGHGDFGVPVVAVGAAACGGFDDIRERSCRGGAADAPVHFGTPEISQLGAAVGRMHTVLQARTDVLRSYADHVTHELKSPLTVIAGAAELLRDPAMAQADRAALLDRVDAATKRMNALLEAQRALAQAQEPMPAGTCRLSEVSQGAQVIRDGVLPINGDAMRLVMAHLVGNAKAHGATQVTAEFTGDTVVVSDNGSGISDGNRDRIFDPFFTTRRDAGGAGMGLAIVSRMLAAQGASIALGEGSGATFVITV